MRRFSGRLAPPILLGMTAMSRGLRLADDKPCLTVLDFVGHQHKQFRFDRR